MRNGMDGWMGKIYFLILFHFQLVIAVAAAAVAQAKSVKGSADWAGSGSGSEEYTNDYITGLDMQEGGVDPMAFTEPRSGNQEKIREIYWTCK